MSDPSSATHKAVLAALQAACSCPVYDGVPQDAAYPYVVIEYQTSDNDDLLNYRMDMRFIFLSIWSRLQGQAEILGVFEEIDTLNEQPLTLDTGGLISLRVDRKRTYREEDSLTYKGQVTLRVLTAH